MLLLLQHQKYAIVFEIITSKLQAKPSLHGQQEMLFIYACTALALTYTKSLLCVGWRQRVHDQSGQTTLMRDAHFLELCDVQLFCSLTFWTELKLATGHSSSVERSHQFWWFYALLFLRVTAGTAIARLSHRNSVCHTGGSGKTLQASINKSSPSAAPKSLVSWSVTLFQKFHRGHPNRGP